MKTKNKPMLKKLAHICILVILISSAGSVSKVCDWGQSHGDEAHVAHCDIDMVPPFVMQWEKKLAKGGITGSSVVSENWLVLLSTLGTMFHDYTLLCFRMDENGLQLVWDRSLSMVERGTVPAITGNRVVCPSIYMLHCFDLETGNTVWETRFDSTPLTPVIVQDVGVAAVTTIPAGPGVQGSLSLVDMSDGNVMWTKRDLEGVQCHFFDIATAGDGNLFCCYATSDEEGIAAFNLQGELLWKRTGELLHKYADDFAYVTLYTSGILFAVGNPTTLFALDGKSGDILWTYEGKTLLDALTSDGKNIYVYSKTDEGVLCLDIHTGKEIWKSPPLFPGDREAQIIVDKSLVSARNCVFICRHSLEYVGNSRIFALDSGTGAVVWESEELEDLGDPLILCDGIVIAHLSSTLVAFCESQDVRESPPPESTPRPTPPAPHDSLYVMIFIGGLAGAFILLLIRYRKA